MANDAEIEGRFWKELRGSPFLMLGLKEARDGHTQPMTAQIDGDADSGPLYFFLASDNSLLQNLQQGARAIATYTAKGHDLFASIHGSLSLDNDQAKIDKLWNPHAAAWFEGGRDDPKLRLLRLDTERAEIWLSDNSFAAGVKRLFGHDPKEDAKDKIAEVSL